MVQWSYTTSAVTSRRELYRYDIDSGAILMVEDTPIQPNGIAFSPDGKTLYICDSGKLAS